MVGAKEVALTYEVLYELLRREKSREELQKLDDNFFASVLAYLREKQQAYDESLAKNDIFSIAEREKLQLQLQNIRKILRDLYDQRERKIILMALNKSRTQSNIIDVSNLLPEEKMFFENTVTIFDRFRRGILYRIVELREPDAALRTPDGEEQKEQRKWSDATTEASQNETDRPDQPETDQPETPQQSMKTVKFLTAVEQFVGKELELYGPFEPEDVARLPAEIAEVLISQGKAVEQP